MNKKNEIQGIVFFIVAIFLFIALIPHHANKNYLGLVGRYTYEAFMFLFGMTSYFFPFIFGVVGYYRFKDEKIEKAKLKITGLSLFIVSSCLLFYLLCLEKSGNDNLGYVLGVVIIKTTSKLGGYLFCLLAIIIAVYLLELDDYPKTLLSKLIYRLKQNVAEKDSQKKQKKEQPVVKIPQLKDIPNIPKEELKVKKVVKPSTVLKSDFELPPLSLLDTVSTDSQSAKEDLKLYEDIIKKTLLTFGVEVEILKTVKGPVVTRFEVKPAPGTKINRIVNLANDMALALKATHIRIIAPLPGIGAVGIEVPNKKATLVTLREVLDSEIFKEFDGGLPVVIGKTIDGENIIADLSDMPHLLVAGATGSGKSVCLNSIIVSLLYRFNPMELKLLLIDPKRVEFTLYNNLPHLYTPVINDPKKATAALKLLSEDMQSRYNKFSEIGARDIYSYNKVAEEKMSYIVVVIDELADLMLIAAREIEEIITRLSQLARGVGIHLVFATQRPSVDVITGVIKANFSSRIALQVFSRVDSRVILDTSGAEDLLGKGDMLFYLASFPQPLRAQCSFVSTGEIKKVIDFWKKQSKPSFNEVSIESEKTGMNETGEDSTELFKNALKLVKERKRASATLLQGALHVSGGKAANLISIMETKGIIGPSLGSKPREIYFDKIEEVLKKINDKVKA